MKFSNGCWLFGLLSTHSYRVPWNYDEEFVDVVRRFAKLKASLMPYLYRNAIETSKTGIPMLRSMILEYPDDRTAAYLDKQYFLGDSLLVAPIFNDKGITDYYLPEGNWVNFLTGEVRQGGKWFKEYHDYRSIPLFAKEGSIVAVGSCDTDCEYDYADRVTYRVCCLQDGKTASQVVYGMENEVTGEISVSRHGDKYQVTVKGEKHCQVEIISENGAREVKDLTAGTYEI